MAISLGNFEQNVKRAIQGFWRARDSAATEQIRAGRKDQGNRAAVTAGKNMDGFVDLIVDLAVANGLNASDVYRNKSVVTLPGFFRPTKMWDLVIVRHGHLIAAIEFKSQVGPSFGNNTNNRCEEAIGNAVDIWTAFREKGFGESRFPFVGYMFLLEEAPGSMAPVSAESAHFPVRSEFANVSYAERYRLLCEKLVREKHYSACALVLCSKAGGMLGVGRDLSANTSLKSFAVQFAGHVAAEAVL